MDLPCVDNDLLVKYLRRWNIDLSMGGNDHVGIELKYTQPKLGGRKIRSDPSSRNFPSVD